MIQSTAAAALPPAGGNKRSQSVSVRVWVAAVGYLGVVVRRCLSQFPRVLSVVLATNV